MYGRLFTSMYDGTLVTRGPWEALVTFQQMIALCDPTGMVDMTREVISRRTSIPLDIITKGIEALEQPDPDSRSSKEDGRRIVRLADHRDWGWQIVNHDHYQRIRSNDDRRVYMREYMRDRRANGKVVSKPLTQFQKLAKLAHADVDVDVDVGTTKSKTNTRRVKVNGHAQSGAGTRLAEDWCLPGEWEQWALAVRHGWTPQGVVRLSITFRDYWLGKPGAAGRKSDWFATWRNWVRRTDKEPAL